MTKAELLALADSKGVVGVTTRNLKSEIVNAILESEAVC